MFTQRKNEQVLILTQNKTFSNW